MIRRARRPGQHPRNSFERKLQRNAVALLWARPEDERTQVAFYVRTLTQRTMSKSSWKTISLRKDRHGGLGQHRDSMTPPGHQQDTVAPRASTNASQAPRLRHSQ